MDISNVGEEHASTPANSQAGHEDAPTSVANRPSADAPKADSPQESTPQQVVISDPLDTAAALQKLPVAANADGQPVKPELVYISAPYTLNSSTARLLLVSYALSGDCHACEVSLSAAVFTKQQNGWLMSSWNDAITTFGEWGKLGGTAEPFGLGGHQAVMLSASYSGQGVVGSYAALLANVNGGVAVVWKGSTSNDSTKSDFCEPDKCSSWKGDLRVIQQSHGGWPNLEFRTAGFSAKDDGSLENMDKTQVLQFDGAKYSVVSTTPASTSSTTGGAGGQPSFGDCISVTDCGK
jgi:hypothetical protein